jgi:hypothetical protein
MNLYIMSRGRAGKVGTLHHIPKAWLHRTFIVSSYSDGDTYAKAYPPPQTIQAPEYVHNYSDKFQWIMDDGMKDHNVKCMIVDDDLSFSRRSPDNPKSLIQEKNREMLLGGFNYVEHLLDEFALVGVHPRQMGQNTNPPYVMNSRIICMQGINRKKTGHVVVNQFPILADVVLNCTLLARGQPNALATTFFQDHGPCQAPGGCSIYRTPDMQRDAVEYLAARFPGYVKVVHRVAKGANWLGEGGRTDYTCQWKQLYAAGLAYKEGRRESPDMEVASGIGYAK